jgi:hypothetical protein
MINHAKSGMTFQETIKVNDTDHSLVSIGTRTKFKFVFYSVGFYSNKPEYYTTDSLITEKSFDSDDTNLLVFRFYRKVTRDRMMEAFREAIETRVGEGYCAEDIQKFETLLGSVEQLNYDDTLQFNFLDGLTMYYNGKLLGTVKDRKFMKVLFSVFMDSNSVTPDIKNRYKY